MAICSPSSASPCGVSRQHSWWRWPSAASIGLAMGQMPALDRALDPWLIVLLNLPALVIIILAYVWFGLNEAAAIGAVALNKIPNVIVTLREGARALDPGLDEMARAYRLSAD